MEKESRYYLNQVIQGNFAGYGTNGMCLLVGYTKNHFCHVPAEDAKPKSNHEAPSDKLQLRNLLRNNWPIILVTVKIMKGKRKTEGLCQMKGDERDKTAEYMSISGWIFWLSIKDIIIGTIDNL